MYASRSLNGNHHSDRPYLTQQQQQQQQRRRRRLRSSLSCTSTTAWSGLCCWNNDVYDLLRLALPTMVIQLSFVVPPFLAASFVGRTFGYLELDGYTLAWGTGNLSTLALLQGILNACDTLGPRAYGSRQFREVGLVAIRGFVMALLVIFPINTLAILFLKQILKALQQDPEVSSFADQFYPVYATSFPFYALYSILWKFLSAQNTLVPMVVSALVCIAVVLPLSMEVFLHYFGFVGIAAAITFFYIVECGFVIGWLCLYQPHNLGTWPGFKAWRSEALKWKPFVAFLALGTGGMLAYLEWAYWEVLTVVIGALGVMPLSAHSIPRQVTDIGYVVPLGIAIALAIRLGSTLSRGDIPSAKKLTQRTLSLSAIAFGIASILMFVYQDAIVHLFTTDSNVIELSEEIWLNCCLYLFMFYLFGINGGISIGLGMQFKYGVVTMICMWFIGMPTTYYFAVIRNGGLPAVWRCIWPPYLLVNLYMGAVFVRKDWNDVAARIQRQQDPKKDIESLGTPGDEEITLGEAFVRSGRVPSQDDSLLQNEESAV